MEEAEKYIENKRPVIPIKYNQTNVTQGNATESVSNRERNLPVEFISLSDSSDDEPCDSAKQTNVSASIIQ